MSTPIRDVVDLVLNPGSYVLLAICGVWAGFAAERSLRATAGLLVGGALCFAIAALLAALTSPHGLDIQKLLALDSRVDAGWGAEIVAGGYVFIIGSLVVGLRVFYRSHADPTRDI